MDVIFIKDRTRENRTKKYFYEQYLYGQLSWSAFVISGESCFVLLDCF